MIEIDVVGTPAPQGSKRHLGRGILVESSKAVGPWREAVVAACRVAGHDGKRLDGPLVLRVTFRLPRPASHYGTRGLTKAGHVAEPDKRPDLDKLVRSTLDALTTAAVIADDSRIVRLSSQKRYLDPGESPGALIHLDRMRSTT